MDPILASNAQNRFCFWGSAPDPTGGAYDAPPDTLVTKGFLLSAVAASRLRHSQFELLARSHKHPSFEISSISPFRLPLFNSVELTNYGYFCIFLSSLTLCFRAFCYFIKPLSNKNFIHLLLFRFDC